MPTRREAIQLISGAVGYLTSGIAQTSPEDDMLFATAATAKPPEMIRWGAPDWQIVLDRDGLISRLVHPVDRYAMNWVRESEPWGAGMSRVDGKLTRWLIFGDLHRCDPANCDDQTIAKENRSQPFYICDSSRMSNTFPIHRSCWFAAAACVVDKRQRVR